MDTEVIASLKKLREPFKPHQISKLPKPTKQQTDEVKNDYKKGIRCNVCQGWHHPSVVHLDYVGHAALTDRLLEVDPFWSWEFLSVDSSGLPVLDKDGGMWIKLTVCGVTRLGYGDAQGKVGGDATKERIGDALRNAAMRFGCALDLWHKGDLHAEDNSENDIETAKQEVGNYFVSYNECVRKHFGQIMDFKHAIKENDIVQATGIWYDFPEDVQITLFRLPPTKGGILTTEERTIQKSNEWGAARDEYFKHRKLNNV